MTLYRWKVFEITFTDPLKKYIIFRSLNWVTGAHLECPFEDTDPGIRDLTFTAINHALEVKCIHKQLKGGGISCKDF